MNKSIILTAAAALLSLMPPAMALPPWLRKLADEMQPAGSGGYRPGVPSQAPAARPSDYYPPQTWPQQPRADMPPQTGSGAWLPSQSGSRWQVRPGQPVDARQPQQPPHDEGDFMGFHRGHQPAPPQVPQRYQYPQHQWPREVPVAPGINLPPCEVPPQPRVRVHSQGEHQVITREWDRHRQAWDQWSVQCNEEINRFTRRRSDYWSAIRSYEDRESHWQRWQQPDWQEWRRGVWDYRGQRCHETWNRCYGMSEHLFDAEWWSQCQWANGYQPPADMPSWWWWQPASWQQLAAHMPGLPPVCDPTIFDPGVTVVMHGGNAYVNGQPAGPAWKTALVAQRFAAVNFGWEPPIPGGRHEWLPLGVWALTAQEQGDATMLMQLSISRKAFISGALTNLLTGENYPISGSAHFRSQRVGFRIGGEGGTVVDCGLAHLTQDVAGAFLHFANGQSQTWLLARLPCPGISPGQVRLPHFERR